MPVIHLETIIDAPMERVFDLARSIDLQKDANQKAQKQAVAGVTSGLIGLDETVTWRARHFGMTSELISKISGFERPVWFRDIQVKGAFAEIRHDHYFTESDGKVVMRDSFAFKSPFGLLGKLLNPLILTGYLRKSINQKNQIIKACAESDDWKKYLS